MRGHIAIVSGRIRGGLLAGPAEKIARNCGGCVYAQRNPLFMESLPWPWLLVYPYC
jgi:hypothetical protein